jgi:uncharacterized membrane protein
MAGQRQGRGSGASAATSTGPQDRVHASKAEAAKAQARAARARAAETAPAAPAASGSRLRNWLSVKEPDDVPAPPRWLPWTTLVLSLAALGLSIYLTIVELEPSALFCTSSGLINCANVLHSPEGHIFGIPVAYFGLAFFVYLLPLNTPWAWARREESIRRLRLVSVIVGMCFVLYLVYAELIEIGNICIYCTSVHAVTFVLFVLIVFDATFRRAPVGLAPARR